MLEDKSFTAAIKLLLFPRFTTIWDILLLHLNADISIEDAIIHRRFDDSNLIKKLSKLALARVRPVVRRENNKTIINVDDIDFWLNSELEIIKTLRDLGKLDLARAVAFDFSSIYFLLLTFYALWKNGAPRNLIPLIEKGEFHQDALNKLLSVLDSKEWQKLFKSVNFYDAFTFLITIYSFSLKKILMQSKDKVKERLFSDLKNFLERSGDLITLEKYRDALDKDKYISKIYYSSIAMPIEALLRETIFRKKRELKVILKTLISILSSLRGISQKAEKYTDLQLKNLEVTAEVSENIILGNTKNAIEKINELGHIILKEKVYNIGISERLLLKFPPEIYSLPPPLVSPPIGIGDALSELSFFTILNEVIEETITSNMELKAILRAALITNPRTFEKFLIQVLVSPAASLAFLFTIGTPLAFLLETVIPLIEIEDANNSREIIREIIQIATHVLKNMNSITRFIITKYKWGASDLQRIITFYLYREIFFASNLITPKLREFLSKDPAGIEFLKTFEEISKFLEKIYRRRVEKREDISDLFV